ncbi:MAG: hypothetical protein ACOWWH_08545 [Eubacteriaceae bacterium]
MIYFITSYFQLCKKLRSVFSLKNINNKNIQLYYNKEKNMILQYIEEEEFDYISKFSYALGKYLEENIFLINIDRCYTNGTINKGELYLINEIIDMKTNYKYYPDILYDLSLNEKSIYFKDNNFGIYDNTSLLFYKTTNLYISQNRVCIIRGYENYLCCKQSINKIIDVYESINKIKNDKSTFFDIKEKKIIKQVEEYLRLTESQKKILMNNIISYKLKMGNLDPLLKFHIPTISTAKERKNAFEQFIYKLL